MVKVTDDPKLAQAGDITSSGGVWLCDNSQWFERATENGPVWVSAYSVSVYIARGWRLGGSAGFCGKGELLVDIVRE